MMSTAPTDLRRAEIMTTAILVDQKRAATGQRKVLRCRAELRFPDASTIVVRAIDIWHTGLTLMSPQVLAPDTCCTVIFYIPSDGVLQIINAAAKVFYCTAEGGGLVRVGLRFLTPDHLRSSLIDRLG